MARGGRRAGRDRPDAVLVAGDGLRVVAGRLRDGLHLLRHRPGRLRTAPLRGRDRRAGAARAARVAAAGLERRVHGHGRAARQSRRGARSVHAAARRRRALRAPPHRVDRRRRARHRTADRVRAARHPRGLAARARRCAPRTARAAEPPLPARGRPRRGPRLRRPQGPPGVVRVRVHQRRQRPPAPCRRAGRPPHRVPRRGARQPDPAQRHRGLSRSARASRTGSRHSRTACARPACRRPFAATAAPTSTPRAASCVRVRPDGDARNRPKSSGPVPHPGRVAGRPSRSATMAV